MAQDLLIRGGRVIDPANNLDTIADVVLAGGRIAAIGDDLAADSAAEVVDARGLLVVPGLIDMHVHLREPGREEAETIASGTAAAVAGGFTAVACMPNTEPALHSDSEIEFVLRQTQQTGACRVYPIGAFTKDRAGEELAEIGLMVRAGAVAFSDDGTGVADAGMCVRAMRYVSMFDKLFIQHCEDASLAAGGCMNAGATATRLGLPGLPPTAEEVMIERDLLLARTAGVRYHVAHISTADSVALVRAARGRGERVTTEVCPHHLLLTEEACCGYDPNVKMNPPLRTQRDVDACLEGVRDGTIDALITDHAPHAPQTKQLEFQHAPFGIIGLEWSLALFAKALVTPGIIDWPRLVMLMSTRPAQLLGVPGGTLATGAPADVTLIRPDDPWTIELERSRSKSRNAPYDGWTVDTRVVRTIVGGHTRYDAMAEARRATA